MPERRPHTDAEQLKADANGMVDGNQLLEVIKRLSLDLHALKGGLAANTSFTREMLDRQEASNARQDTTDQKLNALIASTAEMTRLFERGKQGVGFFQWVGHAIYRLASWLRPVLIAGGLVWALLHGQWPKGGE